MDHSFRIIGIRLIEAHFALNLLYKRDKNKPIELMHRIEVDHKQSDNILAVLVSVSSNDENQPFRFSVAWEGSFAFEEMPIKEKLERIANVNCASIIFPYARETIADMTRRSNIAPLNLPPLNFVMLYEEKKKAESQVQRRKTRKKNKT